MPRALIQFDRVANQGTRLIAEMLIRQDIGDVFDFFSDASNLEQLTPPWLKFRIESPTPIRISSGTLIDYRLRLRGIPLRWRTEIIAWEPPFKFVDRQLKGPYRRWEHTHTFEQVDGGTKIHDVVDYSVFGGALIDRIFVRPDLRKIFAYRQSRIRETFTEQCLER